ncbi:MAG: hypothetical protein IIX73_00485 [Clostridia bacterium]|nr:hypothetical protein [Clostridia bacterium]MBQ5901498.1 hypothetical protein [Clostridia bacterium]
MNYLKVEDLTLEQKLGMLLCARRWDEQEDIDFTFELLKNRALGSIQIPRDENTAKLIKKLKRLPIIPLS